MKKLLSLCLFAVMVCLLISLIEAPDHFLVPYYDGEAEKYGYCTMTGEIVIEPRFDVAELFSDDGTALVGLKDVGWKHIDKKGRYVLSAKKSESDVWRKKELIPFCDGEEGIGKWGYIDRSGKVVIEAKFDFASDFMPNGLASVSVSGGDGVIAGYINTRGEYVIKPVFEEAWGFADNGLAVVRKDGKFGYINESGEFVFPPQFDEASSFAKNGLALVNTYGEGWKYIDEEGNTVIETDADIAESFADNGLARISYGGNNFTGIGNIYYYINEKGEVIKPK